MTLRRSALVATLAAAALLLSAATPTMATTGRGSIDRDAVSTAMGVPAGYIGAPIIDKD